MNHTIPARTTPLPRACLTALLLLSACGDPDPGAGTTELTGVTSDGGETVAGSTQPTPTEPGHTTMPTTGEPPPTTSASDTTTGSTPTDPSMCTANDPKVGWRAELVEYYHGVAGTAEIVDDCTITVTDFNYDGTGIDVRFYGATNGDWAGGFPLSDNLHKPGGYVNEALILTIPQGYALGDLDGLSVWCVDVSIDFGSGVFAPP